VVTDSGGLSATSSPPATLTVLAPPSITVQPTVQLMTVGATATFSVTAAGTAPLAYQWRFNDTNLADKTNRSLALANVQSDNAGNYSVVVTNAFGSVTSRVAVLMFTTVHRIAGITANPDHSISLSLAGVVPKASAPYYDIYPLEVSTNLVDWSPLAMLQRTNDSSAALNYLDSDATSFEKRFYRTSTNFLTTPLSKPSGPYSVGTVSRLLTDPSRTNRYNIRTNSSFLVQCWYPAEARAGVLPEAYINKELTVLFPEIWLPTAASTVAQFVSHALSGLSLATNQTSYPVLIYSHGIGGERRQNQDAAEELASPGYVVVGVDHMDTFASVWPNGQVVFGTSNGSTDLSYQQPFFDNRIKDMLFIVDELSRLNTDDALFGGRLDLERLGAFGKSFGAGAVPEFCRLDARCKAAVLLDAGWTLELAPDLKRLGLQKPFLSMNSTIDPFPGLAGHPPWLMDTKALFTNAINNAFWCQIQDSTHASLSDMGSLILDTTRTGNPTPASRGIIKTVRACTLSFFDKYLKNQDDHLLDNPAAVHPNIINFQSK
jgi:hypothetical protein